MRKQYWDRNDPTASQQLIKTKVNLVIIESKILKEWYSTCPT